MWKSLGFRKNPYDTSPLRAVAEDVELLIGRDDESVEFATLIDSSDNGTVLLSGHPGVGKTSFFNVLQYRMESGTFPFGKRLLAARGLCAIHPDDAVTDIALRILHQTCRNVSEYCIVHSCVMPSQTKKVLEWVNGKSGAGFDFNIQGFGFGGGFGRHAEVPPATEASIEILQGVLASVANDVVQVVGLEGLFIALDNVENLDDDQIGSVLMTFRDTFFSLPNIWWVVIGQTGLRSLVQVLDPRIAERMTGGIELKPISSEELHVAIDRRVEKFHSDGGMAPLTQKVHDFLYASSLGEIRFVFKYASSICSTFVAQIRTQILKSASKKVTPESVTAFIGSQMIESQIPDNWSFNILKKIVADEIGGLGLKEKEKHVLDMIGKSGSATQSDFKKYGLGSGQDFASNYLSKFYHQHLLFKRQEGRRVYYGLRGIAAISSQFDGLAVGTQGSLSLK